MAVSSPQSRIQNVGIDVIGVLAVLTAFFAVSQLITIRILQIPGYLIMAGFDLIQNTLVPGLGGTVFWLAFAAYLVVVSVIIGYADTEFEWPNK